MAFSAQPRKPAWIMNKCLESLDYDVESQDVVFNGIIPEYEEKFSTIEEDITALDTTVQGLDAEIDVLSAAVETKEDKANKTTVVNSSSTDTQYPSAKAVYTAIQNAPAPEADEVSYDHTTSGLTATNVQGAIDELQVSKLSTPATAVNDLNDAYEAGLYFYQNATLNKPTNSGGMVLTLQNQTNGRSYSKQIAFVNSNAFSATNFPIYARESDSSGVFSSWVQFSPFTSV